LSLGVVAPAYGQYVYYESFTNSTAPGWTFQQGQTNPGPRLTSGAAPTAYDPESLTGAQQIDSHGNGWLRLATTTANQHNVVALDTAIPSDANRVTITFDFALWSSNPNSGSQPADGISLFAFDGSVPLAYGANGGSLAYAQNDTYNGL